MESIEQQLDQATPQELEEAGQGSLLDIEPAPIHAPAEIPTDRVMSLPIITDMVTPNPLIMLAGALERSVDVTQLERLFDLAEKYEAKQARMAFAGALAKFQGTHAQIVETKLATVTMQSGGSYTYSYADLDVIMRTIRPFLYQCGLSVCYDSEISDDGLRIKSTCYVMHTGGHTKVTTFVCPLDEAMKVNDSQKMGSANSYACRYNVVNALGLTTGEDDDAGSLNTTSGDDKRRSSATAAKAKPGSDVETHCPIGKHKGDPWDQVPLDYLEWMASNLTDKDDIVERAKRAMADRLDSQNQQAQATAGDEGELTMAECARAITNAKTLEELRDCWSLVPDKHRSGLEAFQQTRDRELSGNDSRGKDSDDDAPPF